MELIRAAVLGIVQGLTEFLPISSSGHLRGGPRAARLGGPRRRVHRGDPARHDGRGPPLLPPGPLAHRHARWLRSLPRPGRCASELDARMGWYLIVATVPIVIFGVAFADQIETGARDLRLIGTMLIVLGFVLYVADRVGREEPALESLAHRPTASRSGWRSHWRSCRACRGRAPRSAPGCFRGFTRESAARFSFLLSIPAVVLSGVYELKDIGLGHVRRRPDDRRDGAGVRHGLRIDRAGCSATCVDHRSTVFVVYRVALGILVLVLVATGAIEANQPALGDYLSTVTRLTRRTATGAAWRSDALRIGENRPPKRIWVGSDAGDGDVVDDEADAGGAHGQPLEVGADRQRRRAACAGGWRRW